MVQKLPYDELRFEMNKSDLKNSIKEVIRLFNEFNTCRNPGSEKKLLDYLDRIGIEKISDIYNDDRFATISGGSNKINFDKIKEIKTRISEF